MQVPCQDKQGGNKNTKAIGRDVDADARIFVPVVLLAVVATTCEVRGEPRYAYARRRNEFYLKAVLPTWYDQCYV